jgi:hypothetical protein
MEVPPPRVSVVICHHVSRLIDRCLQSVADSQGVEAEVLVITSDPTYLNDAVTVYFLDDGPAGKRNFGASKSHAETIIFLDDDLEVSPFCLYELWRFLAETPQCGMAFARIRNMARRYELDDCGSWLTWTGFLWARAGNAQRDTGQYHRPVRILSSKSATCVVRRDGFNASGRFDADYFILGEETDLAWRMWLRGYDVWYCPTALSWHAFGCESIKPRADFYTIRRTITYGCRNYLSLLWTNLGALRLAIILPIHLSAWGISVLGFLCRGDFKRALAIMRGMQEFVARLPALSRKRHRVQSTRVISDRTLFRSIHVSPGWRYYLTRTHRYLTTQLHG